REAVVTQKMPPWYADPAHGQFANDRRLTPEEKNTIVAWVDQGAKEGPAKEALKPVEFAEGWSIGQPDVVIEMPNEFPVPAGGTVDYTWIVVPTGFTEDKWIEKIEVRPGNRSVVHHVVLITRPPGSNYVREAKPGVPFVPPRRQDPSWRNMPDTGQGEF